jgi:hypothetical protein
MWLKVEESSIALFDIGSCKRQVAPWEQESFAFVMHPSTLIL